MSLLKGKNAEKDAEQFLEGHSLIPIARNFFCKFGEIDLIMLDQKEIVFVEVRARKTSSHGTAAESISKSKQKKICLSAQYFLLTNPAYKNSNCRFDVIELNNFGGTNENISWVKDAFWLPESFSIL